MSPSNNSSSNINQYFVDRSVFITGASGFLGKVLLEKLLRSCGSIKTIYVLLRPKSGQNSQQRLNELLDSIVFDKIRKENPLQFNKVIAVSGDVTYPNLGITPNDVNTLINNVNVIFHSAATVRFDEPLKRAIQINVRGTQRVLEIAHQIKNLEAMVHVSTAYCNVIKSDVEEAVYQEPFSPQKIIEVSEWMNDDLLNLLSPHLYRGRPSSYHYTKSLAENLVAQVGNVLPLCIVRPSIITAAMKEPIPGWIDNYNGPTGFLVVNGKGVLRTMHADVNKICDLIPVDIVVNTCISAAWLTAFLRPSSVIVVNCTSGPLNPITWGDIKRLSHPLLIKHPSMELFRYPGASFHSSRIIHELQLQIEHNLPAIFIDFLFKITGHKPILQQVYQKVHRAIAALEYFTTHEWTFKNNNILMLMNSLNEFDKREFNFDIRSIDWSVYFEIYVLGVRQFLLKEKPETLPEARRKIKRLYYGTQLVKLIITCGFVHQLISNRSTIRRYVSLLSRS